MALAIGLGLTTGIALLLVGLYLLDKWFPPDGE